MTEFPEPANAPLVAGFRFTAEENLIAQNLYLRYSPMGRNLRRSMFTVGPLATVGGLASLLQRQGNFPIGILFLFMGVFLLTMPWWMRRAVHLQFDKLPHRNQFIAWKIFPDHLEGKTPSSSFSFEWCVLSHALITAKGCMLYPGQHSFHWLPAHAFSTLEDFENFRQLVASKVPSCQFIS